MNRRIKKQTTGMALDRLADWVGIESEYRDARGRRQPTRAETKRLLLAAMGFRADDDARIDAALQELKRCDWRVPLQPVYVVRAGEVPIKLEVNLGTATRDLCWQLRLEDGTERSGRIEANDLVLIDQCEVGGDRISRRQLPIGNDIPCGYHRLSVGAGESEALVVVAPERCWLPSSFDEGREIWGIAAQLYLLRSSQNWGMGDFSDLRRLTESSIAVGANIVGLNPLHALFPDTPTHASPYSPASRLLLNILYIDVRAVPGFAEHQETREIIDSDEFQQQLRECRLASVVDYSRVTQLKLRVLRVLFKQWHASRAFSETSFESFRREHGDTLERSCVFYSLRQVFLARDLLMADWRQWPEEYRDPSSEAVTRFAEEHREEITFWAWTQWLADSQLARATDAAETMEVGLYRDMAVGADMCGVETWSNQQAVVSGAHIGAPPDIFNPAGQDWGLPPFHPRALKDQRYRSFIELVRANMRHAGALRIDHVMAIQRLYWIPASQTPQNGAYVRYPMEDLIGILALESHRNQCMVVGEDLGTVPAGFRERMGQANILSYRVLFFEQNMKTGVFRRPEQYPRLAVAVASNHDLPSVSAWWTGRDIELRDHLKLYPGPSEAAFQWQLRKRDQQQLRQALRRQELSRQPAGPSPRELPPAVYAYLGRTDCFAALVQLDDITGETDPVNLPGSTSQYPNWQRKLSVTLENLFADPRAQEILKALAKERHSEVGSFEKTLP